MKRPLPPDASQESEEVRAKSRRVYDSRSREDEEDPGGFLDLNATPRGFDLNAPVAEEESLHGQSGWIPVQDEVDGKEDTAESKPSVVEDALQSQVPITTENEPVVPKSEDSDSSVLPCDSESGSQKKEVEEEKTDVKEEYDEPELKETIVLSSTSPVSTSAVLQRNLDSASTLGIDDDLDILRSIWNAHEQNDLQSLDTVLVEACEELAKSPFSPSRYHYLSCLYVSKKLPEAFGLPKTLKVLLGFLKSPTGGQPTVKRQIMLPVLACKLLNRAFASEPHWPLDFIQIYLEDATGLRSWIEHEGCKEFVANLLTAFPDVELELSGMAEDSNSTRLQDTQGGSGEMLQGQAVKCEPLVTQSQGMMPMKNRYPSEDIRAKVRTEFLQALNQLLGSASTKDNPRQLLKLLMQGAGYEEVRVVASSMLDAFLNNTVHLRAAKALLDRIVQHTRGTSDNDCTTVANLLALRIISIQAPGQMKSLHGNIFGDMVTQLVRRRPEYATLALKTFVTAEVNNKNPHNLKSIILVLKAMPEAPPPEHELALIFQELAANDEYRFQLRDLVRRMMKQVGSDIDVHALCHGLMQPWPVMAEQHEVLKEAWLKQLVDLACQLLLLAVVPYALDENVVSAITSSPANLVPGTSSCALSEKLLQLEKFSLDAANFQVEAMAWCTSVLAVYLPSMAESQFTCIVRQLLFLETSEVYYPASENVSETDLVALRLLSMGMPAPEEILARLILMAISNVPLTQGEALKLIERLVWRAAALRKHFNGALTAASVQLPAAIFKLASFNIPGVTSVAQLVVKDMYWRACLVVLIIAVYNAKTIGWFVWETFPTIRSLMEALLTCTRTFLPIGGDEMRISEARKLELGAEQRDSKAEEAISAFLDVTEKRRNDPSFPEIDNSGTLTSSPGTRVSGQGGESRGKVMFLNQTGPIRRPPQSVVDELDRVDEAYQLGQFLRKSRNPDFFAVITKLQTLAQGWPWLQKIIVGDPEVITFLPPVWQCELLFMHEGQHPFTRNLFLDIGKLRYHLHQVMVEQSQSKEVEIELVVEFLASKLLSKSGVVRSRARCCFECLFNLPFCPSSDVNMSVPSSPQDFKRVDPSGGVAVTGGSGLVKTGENALISVKRATGLSAGTSHSSNMNAPVVQVPSTSLSGGVLRASPGVNHISVSDDGGQDKFISSAQVSVSEDDCGWLEVVEKIPTASRVVSVLAPAIQKAIQRESSICVVKAYLQFLKNHLSGTALACTIAMLVVRRKMLARGLLLGSAATFVATEDTVELGSVSQITTSDLVLESLCKALESGTVSDLTWEELTAIESPIVTFVSPQVAVHTKEFTLLHVRVHQIIVDAALDVLSLLGQEEAKEKRGSKEFLQLLNVLFPAFDTVGETWRWDLEVPVGWLEEAGGKKPLFSESQAMSLVCTNDSRLVKAGLSVLSLESKLKLCEGFGLSSVGITALLNDLDPTKDPRLEFVLGSASFSGLRLKKLKSCVSTLVKAESKCCANLLRMLEQKTISSSSVHSQMQQSTSAQKKDSVPLIERSGVDRLSLKHSLEEMSKDVFEWLTLTGRKKQIEPYSPPESLSMYVQLRQHLQRALLSGDINGVESSMHIIFDLLENAEGNKLADLEFVTYGLPILVLLSYQRPCIEYNGSQSHVKPRDLNVRLTSDNGLFSVETLTDLGLQNSVSRSAMISGIFNVASKLLEELQMSLANACETIAAKYTGNSYQVTNGHFIAPTTMREHVKENGLSTTHRSIISLQDVTFDAVDLAPAERFEALLRCYLYQKLRHVWEGSYSYGNSITDPEKTKGKAMDSVLSRNCVALSRDLLGLLRRWRSSRVSSKAVEISCDSSIKDMRESVEFSGRCGLVMELLGFLDPEFDSEGIVSSVICTSGLHMRSKAHPGPSIPAVILASVVHKSSWNTLSKILKLLLDTDLDVEIGHASKNSLENSGGSSPTAYDGDEICEGMETVMEFISLCVQHPRAKLACRMSDEVEPHKSNSNLSWSWLSSSSARALTKHAVVACVFSKLAKKIDMSKAADSEVSIRDYVHALERRSICPASRALKVLLLASHQGSHIMSAIVQQLCSYESEHLEVMEPTSFTIKSVTSARKAVAQSLLWGLYLAFPVSVKTILQTSVKEVFTDGTQTAINARSTNGQTCSLNTVLYSAVWSICNGNEKESNAAYGFCQEFARQHPLLLIPYLPSLKLLLKELLLHVKQGEPQVRATVTRALSMGLGLLDALRPHVIVNSNSSYRSFGTSENFNVRPIGVIEFDMVQPDLLIQKSDLETILDLYFEVLQGLDIQDRSLFAKVVSRFSDFLCHCVAAGGRSRQYVSEYRTPILETTAQTFSKIKKIGFLLNLLDKPTIIPPAEGTFLSGDSFLANLAYSKAATPSIPIEDILKVRTQLQQSIKIHTKDLWKDEGLAFYSTGKPFRVSHHLGEDVEKGSLSATLNDLDRASARMPAILSVLEDSLVQLIGVKDTPLRERIYTLLERALLHCPSEGSASNIVQGLVKQLTSSDSLRAKSAARNASRFFHFSTELQESILLEMLQLGRIASDELQQLLQGLLTITGYHSN